MKRLRRSRRTKVLGGVAAGFAAYFDMDVTVMRLLFALLAVTIPNAILAYILAWVIIPEEPLGDLAPLGETVAPGEGGIHVDDKAKETCNLPPTADQLLGSKTGPDSGGEKPVQGTEPEQHRTRASDSPDRNRQVFGYILVVFGVAVLAKRYVPSFLWRLPTHLVGQLWPVLIILVGAALIFGALRGR